MSKGDASKRFTDYKGKRKRRIISIFLISIALLGIHMAIAHKRTELIWNERSSKHKEFYVFAPEAYKDLSMGTQNLLSRLNVLYALYAEANINIPSINFPRLIQSMEGSRYSDPLNKQSYLHVAYYWSWANKPEARSEMTKFLKTGLDTFPDMWDIPYSIYQLTKDSDQEDALGYLRMAAARASEFGGPDWIIDYPAILMTREGQAYEALLWLKETYLKTESEKQREIIMAQVDKIQEAIDKGDFSAYRPLDDLYSGDYDDDIYEGDGVSDSAEEEIEYESIFDDTDSTQRSDLNLY